MTWILITVITLQAGALAALLVQRRRTRARGLAEMKSAELHPLIDLAPIGIAIVHDPDFTRVTTNAAFDRIFGHSLIDVMKPGAATPNGITILSEGREVAGADLPILRALHEGATVAAQELELRLPDRQPLAIYAGASPILDGRGEVVGCIGSFFDITERKRAELDALEQRNRLAHLWRVATLGELSGRIAHELSQPLTAILANVQAAQRMLSAPQPQLGAVREILEEIVEADLHAADVIQRTRALMRNEPVARRPIDLNRAVEHALELIHVELSARNVVARVVLSRQLPPVLGDDVQLQQVLLNLVINACDAMNEVPVTERRLTIVTRLAEEEAVQLYVRDRGTGIPDDLLDAVFRPFVSTKHNGLGLGLSICKSIVADHGGKLWAYNNSDRGATFALALPRVNTPGNGRVSESVQRAASGRPPAGPVS